MIIRINKTRDYTVMSNHHFKDRSLSLKAKGLLSQMLSLPDDWGYSVSGLCAINKENETAIESALKELKKGGYLRITKQMPDKTDSGRIEYIYDIYEQPVEIQDPEKQDPEILPLEIQGLENQGQLNTKKSKTKKQSTNDIITNYTSNPELAEALRCFGEMRNAIKRPLTERAWKIIFNKLNAISSDASVQIAVLNQSIEHSWQTVYELKERPSKRQTEPQERLGWIDDI